MRRLIFALLLVLSVYRLGHSQSTLNFPRAFAPTQLGSTGFAIVNPSSTPATATFILYAVDGGVISTSTQNVPAAGQLAKLGTELFPGAAQGGWVQATSSVTGLQGFWLSGDFATFSDGAEAAASAPDVLFPLVAESTEINVVNPGTNTTSVTFRLLGTAGTEIAAAATRNISARGVLQEQASALFPTANLANATHIRVTASSPVTGAAVISGFLVNPSWAVTNAVDSTLTVAEANFPHVISGVGAGGNYTTVVGVTNLTASSQNITITFVPESGGIATAVQRTLPANGSLRETAQDLFSFPTGFQNGWVKVTGTAITGFVAYADAVAGGLAVVPVQVSPQTQLLFAHIADLPPWYTGIALLNTTTTTATVDVFAMTPAGALIGGADNVPEARFSIGPNSKTAKLLSELVPQTQQRTSDGGFVFVRSSQPLYGLELFFTRNLSLLSNVAAGSIPSGITFTPPAPPAPLSLTSISANPVARGTTLTLNGTGFDPTPSSNTIRFTTGTGVVDVPAATATTVQLTVTVPSTAITGPLSVSAGGQTTSSIIVQVTDVTTQLQTPVSVATSATTAGVDLYVPPPSGTLNATTIGVLTDGQAFLSQTSADLPRGQNTTLIVAGSGISQSDGTTLTISGAGTIISNVSYQVSGSSFLIIASVGVDSAALPGPRNVILTNSNADVSVLTGGVFIR